MYVGYVQLKKIFFKGKEVSHADYLMFLFPSQPMTW